MRWWRGAAVVTSVEGLGACDQLGDAGRRDVPRKAGMDDARGAALGGLDELLVRARVGVLDVGVLLLVVGEHVGVELHALVARGALVAVDPRSDVARVRASRRRVVRGAGSRRERFQG